MKVRWTRLAVRDLESAREYIALENPAAAHETVERIAAAARALRSYPYLGRSGRVEGTRELIIPGTPFIVAYRVTPRQVEILAMIHGSRRWPESL